MNPNDNSAKYYDSIYSVLKPDEVTSEELDLTKSLISKDAQVLDIACGTGRHLIPLSESGYKLTGVESSTGMIQETRNKIQKLNLKNVELFEEDIFKVNLQPKAYNLITLFWNSFNEICLTKENAKKLLENCHEWLSADGKILINIDDSAKVDPSNFDFNIEISKQSLKYNLFWKTKEYDVETNTSTSLEQIEVFYNNKKIDEVKSEIKQRYWSFEEIKQMAENLGFKASKSNLNTSTELYIILEK